MASDEQFSLCWNNFHANMSAGFHGLLSRGDLVDVTLAAEGRLLQAHKLVLSVCSPYFQEMFKMNPTQHPIVFLKDVSHSALRDLLQFMYQGEVNVKQEELASFISTAEQLQVKGLTGNSNEESSTPSKPKPTSRPGPRSSQQRQSVMTKLETDLDSKPSSTPVAIKRPNRPSIASNNSSSSQSGPAKRKCVDPLEAGPSGSAKDEFVTIPDEDENNAVAPKMEPEFVNESMWDEDDDGTNNDETNFGEDDSNMEMTGFDSSATGDGNLTGTGEGGAVGDAQGQCHSFEWLNCDRSSVLQDNEEPVASLDLDSIVVATPQASSSLSTSTKSSFCKRKYNGKRRRRESEWLDNKRKINRSLGKDYISRNGTLVKAKKIGAKCPETCRLKCHTKVSEEQRKRIFDSFWLIGDRAKQWEYLAQLALRKTARRMQTDRKCNRKYTIKYHLPSNTEEQDILQPIEVCKTMFLNTFSVGIRSVYTAIHKNSETSDRNYRNQRII
ncbi:broad-complex core protein isoforms 1/2/3/4/5-like isoform X3 [Aricia agestis]|uniref:broad-complex core protein isoforms 1/2/3/4/5-like isoform X3 n=1 Tax=Aricia agestis TaxID=91739 RepID=UPI001C208A77|nr:broad-complex core protein isoforms 1/2/3/4/5-like isoform X3 [Aricia agestis]